MLEENEFKLVKSLADIADLLRRLEQRESIRNDLLARVREDLEQGNEHLDTLNTIADQLATLNTNIDSLKKAIDWRLAR